MVAKGCGTIRLHRVGATSSVGVRESPPPAIARVGFSTF
jgi:hypothetical protein